MRSNFFDMFRSRASATAIAAIVTAAVIVPSRGACQQRGDSDFALGRNTEILINMLRDLSTQYVDKIDADRLLEYSAEGMVAALDPYTEYLTEDKMSNFEVMTTGKYGGVGSLIRKKGDYIIFAQPYEGSPADRAGIRIG
ncbi:MAG: hypothetical protein K2O07_03510, partial [Alistipes sp.]|nr:hypothetical protein [Alistipes sp.]